MFRELDVCETVTTSSCVSVWQLPTRGSCIYLPLRMTSELVTQDRYTVDRSTSLEMLLQLFWCRAVINLPSHHIHQPRYPTSHRFLASVRVRLTFPTKTLLPSVSSFSSDPSAAAAPSAPAAAPAVEDPASALVEVDGVAFEPSSRAFWRLRVCRVGGQSAIGRDGSEKGREDVGAYLE